MQLTHVKTFDDAATWARMGFLQLQPYCTLSRESNQSLRLRIRRKLRFLWGLCNHTARFCFSYNFSTMRFLDLQGQKVYYDDYALL